MRKFLRCIGGGIAKLFGEGLEWKGYRLQITKTAFDSNERTSFRPEFLTYKFIDGRSNLLNGFSTWRFSFGIKVSWVPRKKGV